MELKREREKRQLEHQLELERIKAEEERILQELEASYSVERLYKVDVLEEVFYDKPPEEHALS